jgi:putative acetyltransferase
MEIDRAPSSSPEEPAPGRAQARPGWGGVEIRPRGGDVAPLADLWVASWLVAMPSIDFIARRDWFFTYVETVEQGGGETHCVYDGAHDGAGRLVGFILIHIGRGVLEQIVVAPERFGDGLGAVLLDYAKALCRSGLSLDVNVDNPRACRFYEKHGFVKAGQGINPRSSLPIWHLRWVPK